MLEKTLENPLDCKEIQPVHPKGTQSWIFIGRSDTEVEPPTVWPPDAKGRLTGEDPDGGKDWRQEQKRMTEEQMLGWHHQLNGHKFEQAPGDGEGKGSLTCCSPWGGRFGHNWATEQQQRAVMNVILFSFIHSSIHPTKCLFSVFYHASKVMLKILQARLQQYVNRELHDVQAGFRKGRGTRDQIANIRWIMEKAREFQKKHLFLLYWLCQSLWLCGSQQTVENSERDGNTRPPDLPLEKCVCRSGSNS